MPGDEGPLSRWSRRKTETRRRGRAAPVITDPPSAAPAVAGTSVAPLGDAASSHKEEDAPAVTPPSDEPAEVDLPDIDSLGPESDFTVFMKEGVPAHLRTLALRKLWTRDPVLANLDGLVDYGGDFTHIKSGVFEAVKAVLDAGEERETPAEKPERQAAGSETENEDTGAPAVADADEPHGDDVTAADGDGDHLSVPAGDAGRTKV